MVVPITNSAKRKFQLFVLLGPPALDKHMRFLTSLFAFCEKHLQALHTKRERNRIRVGRVSIPLHELVLVYHCSDDGHRQGLNDDVQTIQERSPKGLVDEYLEVSALIADVVAMEDDSVVA